MYGCAVFEDEASVHGDDDNKNSASNEDDESIERDDDDDVCSTDSYNPPSTSSDSSDLEDDTNANGDDGFDDLTPEPSLQGSSAATGRKRKRSPSEFAAAKRICTNATKARGRQPEGTLHSPPGPTPGPSSANVAPVPAHQLHNQAHICQALSLICQPVFDTPIRVHSTQEVPCFNAHGVRTLLACVYSAEGAEFAALSSEVQDAAARLTSRGSEDAGLKRQISKCIQLTLDNLRAATSTIGLENRARLVTALEAVDLGLDSVEYIDAE
jgi:hypothetical protein